MYGQSYGPLALIRIGNGAHSVAGAEAADLQRPSDPRRLFELPKLPKFGKCGASPVRVRGTS